MPIMQTRRRILAGLSAAGAIGMLGAPAVLAAEERLETTKIKLSKMPAICLAPQYVADELLHAEGFTEVQYVPGGAGIPGAKAIGDGEVDFSLNFAAPLVMPIDAGTPLTVVGGSHIGCFELFGHDGIRGIVDLKGKRVGVPGFESGPHIFLTAMATLVGLDPAKDIDWVTDPKEKPVEQYAAGKIDAFLGFPPEPQELNARHIGNVIVNSSVDHPWSQYFCCMLAGNRTFVRKHPVATKRVLRAILKATDLCASNPERVARCLVDGGFTSRYDYALQTFRDVPYNNWRQFNPEDTIRFYALRLREAGMVKSTPQKIIAAGTDWRFLNELKQELKA